MEQLSLSTEDEKQGWIEKHPGRFKITRMAEKLERNGRLFENDKSWKV